MFMENIPLLFFSCVLILFELDENKNKILFVNRATIIVLKPNKRTIRHGFLLDLRTYKHCTKRGEH